MAKTQMLIGENIAFISYAREDEDLARSLRDRLSEVRMPSFIDTGYVSPGDEWRSKTIEALHSASVVLVVCTKRSINSQEVTFEWAYALALGVPVLPIVYERGLKLHGALAGLDRLNFVDPANRQWDRLISTANEVRNQRRLTLGRIRHLGIEGVLAGRAEITVGRDVDELLGRVIDESEVLVVGRSLESWARHFQAIQDRIDHHDVRIRAAIVDPSLEPQDWMVPSDYAQLDLTAAIEKFNKIVAPPASSHGSFQLFYLPSSPIFSFVHFYDSIGACGLLEFGASLTFDERFAIELRTGATDSLLAAVFKVHDAMLSSREPVICLPPSQRGSGD
jgi:TIR domain-containing protein